MSESTIHLFGIRHHGPGCARSLLQALEELQPDCLLVEGPQEGEEMLPLMLHPQMQPPVALLLYASEDVKQASFYPFAEFSPEWQALRYGLQRQIAVRFFDLPVSHQLALQKQEDERLAAAVLAQSEEDAEDAEDEAEDAETPLDEADEEDVNEEDANESAMYGDPLDWLAQAAGYSDGESWWNHMVEERSDGLQLFEAIREAMLSLRRELPPQPRSEFSAHREQLREAYMRKCLRQAQKEGFQRIAVVCGAWHLPALYDLPSAASDNELLKGLPKLKVQATWVPWTYANLSSASGYGAGVSSPAWYEHLWKSSGQQRSIGWLARAARLFRTKDLDCSAAHVIEAARLAETLAALRERPQPGLDELWEALRVVVCMGEEAPLQLIRQELIQGSRLGSIPPEAPMVPLQRDLEQQQKSLRLKPEATSKELDLDLRQPNDLARSHLLHRLHLLGIRWGVPSGSGRRSKGTFHEVWELRWRPELVISIVDASRWGSTLLTAASAYSLAQARQSNNLAELARLVNQVLLADLHAAIDPITQCLEDLASTLGDVLQLLQALPALVSIARYGNVRQTDTAMVEQVLHSLIPRAAIGLPSACCSLNEEAAQSLLELIKAAHSAIVLLEQESLLADWQQALQDMLRRDGSVHGLLRGLACRLLFDAQVLPLEEVARYMSLTLSAASAPEDAATWLDGFLCQNSMVLLHDNQLWALLDEWLSQLSEEHFVHILPMLRRTFSSFPAAERRQLGERARRPQAAVRLLVSAEHWDKQRAKEPLPLLRRLLGLAQTPREHTP